MESRSKKCKQVREDLFKYWKEIREDGGFNYALANGLLRPHAACPRCASSDRVSLQKNNESPEGWAFKCGACVKRFFPTVCDKQQI